MNQNLTTENLMINNYVLKDQLAIDDLVPFLQKSLKIKNVYSNGYHLFTFIAFGLLIFTLFSQYSYDGFIDIGYGVAKASYGMGISLLLIPVHELIHGLVYKLSGAKTVKYEANWRKLYFVATAHHFVADYRIFKRVALAPFASVALAAGLAAVLLPDGFTISALSVLFIHTIFCSGDFGLLTYMKSIKAENPVTYDDMDQRVSYFYTKKS